MLHDLQEVGVPKQMKVVMHTCNGIYYAIDTVELLCILGILKVSPPFAFQIAFSRFPNSYHG